MHAWDLLLKYYELKVNQDTKIVGKFWNLNKKNEQIHDNLDVQWFW